MHAHCRKVGNRDKQTKNSEITRINVLAYIFPDYFRKRHFCLVLNKTKMVTATCSLQSVVSQKLVSVLINTLIFLTALYGCNIYLMNPQAILKTLLL